MNPEIESILAKEFNNYVAKNIDNITFRINGKDKKLYRCSIAMPYQFTPSIEESDISDEGLDYSFHLEAYYNADLENENKDIISINGTPGIKDLSADGTASIEKNPNYKENSNAPESRDKYIVEIQEIADNKITISNHFIHI